MSIEALKTEAASLDEQSRKELVSFLISLGARQRAERARRLAEIRDDPNAGRWLTPEQFQERLERMPEPADDPRPE
jgi:hypothetical protein